MTQSVVVHSELEDSAAAGNFIAAEITKVFGSAPPQALILFASPKHNFPVLLNAIKQGCHPGVFVGCSSAGEFASGSHGNGSVSAIALSSAEMKFNSAIGRNLKTNTTAAAAEIAAQFQGMTNRTYAYRYALVLTDALAGYADTLVEQLALKTAGMYQLFGGGAGDDAAFKRTQVFQDTEIVSDAAVALEILSKKPFGIGVQHGWELASEVLRVTEVQGARLVSLNSFPTVEAFQRHAAQTNQHFDRSDPLPFFLHNILGIDTGRGYKLRVPLGVEEDGSVLCAAEIPVGSKVHIMRATAESSAVAASTATASAVQQLGGRPPKVALFFDCVATRLRMGKGFGTELKALQEVLGNANYAGCNTYGQIARTEGQFSGFHNCTAVVCVIPE